MSIPEGYRPTKGDVVVLHGQVKFNVEPEDEGDVHVTIVGAEHHTIIVPLDKIVDLRYRAWTKGNLVQEFLSGMNKGEVIAVCEDYVWVKVQSTGNLHTFHANALERQPVVDVTDLPPTTPTIPPQPIGNRASQ